MNTELTITLHCCTGHAVHYYSGSLKVMFWNSKSKGKKKQLWGTLLCSFKELGGYSVLNILNIMFDFKVRKVQAFRQQLQSASTFINIVNNVLHGGDICL